MANINVVVQDANNVQLNLTPAPATTLIAEGGNNVILELTPTSTQVISLDRGVAGVGIESITVVTIDGDQYLHIVFTNGSSSDVGPISATSYTGVTPIVVNNTTNQISLDTVPVASGGTGATTASGARTNLGLGSIATQDSNSVTITGGSITGITDLAIADGGTGASTASDARTNLGLGTAAVLTAGAALGAATLDAGGTVPLSQIPASIQGGLIYQGTWNASANTPTLTSSVGTKGHYYAVSVAGSTNLNGITDWSIGDLAVFNGSVWEQIDNTDAVTSVNGYTGTVVLNAADVGALASVTSADGSITVSQVGTAVDLAVSAASPASTLLLQVRNSSGATMTKGTVVYVNGATGQLPTIAKALATSDATSAQTQGLVTADISNNSNGYVTIIGLVTNLDTSAYSDGEQLYLSGVTAGAMTGTKPYAPIHLVYVGVVTHAHPTQGKIQVKVQNGYELDELHNVSAQTPSNGQTIVYNSSTSLWENNTVSLTAGVNGILPVANGGTGVTASTGSGSVVLSTSPTFVTPLLGTPTSGVLTNCTGYTYANLSGSVPTWNQNTTGTASNVTGTVAIANGGTGSTTAAGALTNLGAYAASNPSGYTSNIGTVTSVGGTGTVNGLTLTGTVTSTGNLTLGGTLSGVANSALTNSAITFGATSQALGSTVSALNAVSVGATTPSTGSFTSLTNSGNLTFTGTGNRITGDFSNATVANRALFQTNTVNGATRVGFIPNGTAVATELALQNNADPTNAGLGSFRINASDLAITSGITGTGTYLPMTFYTGGSERMRVDTSGNVGIGTSSPSTYNPNTSYNKVTSIVQSDQALTFGSYYQGGTGQTGFIRSSNAANTGITEMKYEAYIHKFFSASGASGTERMRIDPDGTLLVGKTAESQTVGAGVQIKTSTGSGQVSCVGPASTNSNDTYHVYSTGAGAYRFYVEYGGQIRATVTSIAAISDISLKENVRDLETGIQEVMALRPVRFDWKEETKLGTKDIAGFIAQEVESVMPDLVSDGMYSDTETKKTVRMGDMLPTLVKAIQEQQAIITQLQADVAALKGN